ncbi:hypothetical protein QWY93_12385 [Echinicola jeungdonensis]|uniref:Uncharacterized protein n=1 Tax=Echinicola jeungdonensis TaxID=709343 RepID=A0ABV5J3I8_9BACT|nr:hypothetical protein [Echinicola jeungdonensis]MDN3670123.1 hypothetical protein [Echinicola jeungdonensis]
MKTLSENWISEGLIDFEYKKYILLAYLKEVDRHFNEVKLYPSLADLIRHYQKLKGLSEEKDTLSNSFPKRLAGLDIKKMVLKHQPLLEDDEMMKELEEIISYSMPMIKHHIDQGKSIYDFIENHLEIEPVGLSPIYQKEGYVFFSYDKTREIYVYRYKMKLFESSLEKLRGIALNFLLKMTTSLTNTFERIKMDLVKNYKELPNPATWLINSTNLVPLEESLVPVSKRLLMRVID